ncbi:MAG: hypothetical protein FWE20_12010 [Defluviitaleaceae bacterium]|nr:hypothetical protein [Defluviitaleaceae bacterium]
MMKCVDLNRLLIKNFPQLQQEYSEQISWQDGENTGAHVVYGDVFNPYLIEIISNSQKNEMQTAFDFVEQMLMLDDEYAENVMCVTVLESVAHIFRDDPRLFEHLGEKSAKLMHEIFEYLYRT